MKEDLKEILLMGLGAMSLTEEKTKELKQELRDKGDQLYKSGKIKNEELKHNIEEKIKENVTIVYDKEITKEDIANKIKTMDEKEKKEIISMLKDKKD